MRATQGFNFAADDTWQFESVGGSRSRKTGGCGCAGQCAGECEGGCNGGRGCGQCQRSSPTRPSRRKSASPRSFTLTDLDGDVSSHNRVAPGRGVTTHSDGELECPPQCLQMLPQVEAECCSTNPPFQTDKCLDLAHIYAECLRAFGASGVNCPMPTCRSGCPQECLDMLEGVEDACCSTDPPFQSEDCADMMQQYFECQLNAVGPGGTTTCPLPECETRPRSCPSECLGVFDQVVAACAEGCTPECLDLSHIYAECVRAFNVRPDACPIPPDCHEYRRSCMVRTLCYPSGTLFFRPFHHCYIEVTDCSGVVSTYEYNFDDGGLRAGFEVLGRRGSLVLKNSAPRGGVAPQPYARRVFECPDHGPDPCHCIEREALAYPFPYVFDYGIPIYSPLIPNYQNPMIYGPNSNSFVEYVKRHCNAGGGAIPLTAIGYYFFRNTDRAFRIWRDQGRGRPYVEIGGRWFRRRER